MNKESLNKIKPFLYGKLLGDANLQKPYKHKPSSRLKIEHSTKQLDYLLHCYQKIHNFCSKPYVRKRKLIYKGTVRIYETALLQSKSLPILTTLYHEWYEDIKTLPKDLEDVFNKETLAYWFMDDGYIKFGTRNIAIHFCTQGFCESDVDRLVTLLNDKYDLDAIKSPCKGNYLIRIGKKDKVKKFKDLVRPYIVPSMQYKIRDCK